jgi:uncharacterized protein (TIGR03437 family)
MQRNAKSFWAVTACLTLVPFLTAQVPGFTVTTVAGGGTPSPTEGDGGPARSATLFVPAGLAVDAAGNLYIADAAANVVRRVSPAGTITTFAGGGSSSQGLVGDGGPATSAVLRAPAGLATDAAGNLYIADSGNSRIRKVTPSGTITTVAGPGLSGVLGDGGLGINATLRGPTGVAVDGNGNLFIADLGNNRIRKVSVDGTIATIAGGAVAIDIGDGGKAVNAVLRNPSSVAVDAGGNVYISDYGHSRIRKVSPAGLITTFAGSGSNAYYGDGGPAGGSAISCPNTFLFMPQEGLAVDNSGNLYIADTGNGRLRMVSPDGTINTIGGNGSTDSIKGDNGPATATGLASVTSVAAAADGRVYVSEQLGYVRVLAPSATPGAAVPSLAQASTASAFGQFATAGAGSWIEIYGSYLSPNTRTWTNDDFNGFNAPTSLDGVSVTIGGQSAFVSYISPGQINVQVPINAGTGVQPMVVTTRAGKVPTVSIPVSGVQPGLLAPPSFVVGIRQYAVALLPDGSTYDLPTGAIPGVPSRLAKPGETITLYGIGFGTVTPSVPDGQIVQTANSLALPFHLFLNGVEAKVTYAGLAPGLVGLYQFNVLLPNNFFGGLASLTFTLGGIQGQQPLVLAAQ